MDDPRGLAYLQDVFTLDPSESAELLLARRQEFLRPADIVQAELAGGAEGKADFRTHLLLQLSALRRDFWLFSRVELEQRLAVLQSANHPETTPAAARLAQVAQQRQALLELRALPAAHPAFVGALAQILIAPAAEANRLREREQTFIRPEQNPRYEEARQAVQGTARIIAQHYPALFELEEGWLTELCEYNPRDETPDESGNTSFGMVVLLIVGFTFFAGVAILVWVCS